MELVAGLVASPADSANPTPQMSSTKAVYQDTRGPKSNTMSSVTRSVGVRIPADVVTTSFPSKSQISTNSSSPQFKETQASDTNIVQNTASLPSEKLRC